MTDDQLRESCARALGRQKLPPGVNDPLGLSLPPLDGNTAMALLLRATDTASVMIENPCYGPAITVRTYAPIRVHRFADKTVYTIILAALLALGEISAEDVADNA